MKKLLLVFLLVPVLVWAGQGTIPTGHVVTVGGGTSYQDFSDSFTGTSGAPPGWTALHGSTWSLNNNNLYTATANQTDAIVYSTQTNTVNQYNSIQITEDTYDEYPGLVFRRTGSGGYYYKIDFHLGTNSVTWYYGTDDADGSPDGSIATGTFSTNLAAGDYVYADCIGTGNDTVIRVWKSTGSPGAYSTWGSSPQVTFTTDPGAYAADIGKYIGVSVYIDGA